MGVEELSSATNSHMLPRSHFERSFLNVSKKSGKKCEFLQGMHLQPQNYRSELEKHIDKRKRKI